MSVKKKRKCILEKKKITKITKIIIKNKILRYMYEKRLSHKIVLTEMRLVNN